MTKSELAIVIQAMAPVIRAYTTQSVAEFAARLERLAVAETAVAELGKETVLLRERVAAVEVRSVQPGPPGPAGTDGADGKNGAPGLRYRDVYRDGIEYAAGDVVTWGGSAWHCNDATTAKPGNGARAWTLMVKCGRDGRDKG